MKNVSFEAALKKLEKIVDDMEGGEMPLETSLKKFEEGMKLSRFCTDKLEEVQQKISRLVEDGQENVREENFSTTEPSES